MAKAVKYKTKAVRYKKLPFDKLGRKLFTFLIGELASIWIVAAAALILLPTLVPAQFTWGGVAMSYGFSSVLVVVALLFSVVPIVVLLVSILRFRIVNNYPYLMVAPSFYANARSVAPSRRSYWVNQYFKVLLVAGVYMSGILLILIMEIYTAASKSYINGYLSIIAPIVAITAVAVLLILLVKNLYRKMGADASSKKRRR